MWCQHCRQDVPALPSSDQQGLCCPRCGADICADTPEKGNLLSARDQWELNEQLRHIEHVLHATPPADDAAEPPRQEQTAWLDACHADPHAWHVTEAADQPVALGRGKRRAVAEEPRTGSAWIWLALSLGTVCFVCGGVLLGWSFAAGRQELWSLGLPVAMVGQVMLLAGLVFQFDRLWRDNRRAAEKLDSVDEQLNELKNTATLLGAGQGSPSSVFYSHFAAGAHPRILLTDLKSQIDLLAIKLAQDDR